jgi:hypothetical protein
MTQARHEYSARRGQESYDADAVDSVTGLANSFAVIRKSLHSSKGSRSATLVRQRAAA